MRITPLEIRQKSFEKKLRGYDKDEVTAFLETLSTEWERIIDENKEFKIKLAQSEKEVQKLREVESSLFKTLKTAEDTGANLVGQANKAAELHLKEAQMNAEAVLGESKSKAKAIIEDAELKAKEMILEMQDAIRILESNYKTIENQRDNLISELANLANDVKERVKRTSISHKRFELDDHLIKVREMVRESEDRINKEQLSIHVPKPTAIPDIEPGDQEADKKLDQYIKSKKTPQRRVDPQPVQGEEQEGEGLNGEGSFFDQVGN